MIQIIKGRGVSTRGFTIVELLIVVVVIAILAAITIVSYNGITSRASASNTLTLVRQWTQSIEMYRSLNNVLPNDWTCLGNAVTDFPTELGEGIGPGQCERNFIVSGQPSDWTSEFKTVPTAGQTLPTSELLRANMSLPTGLLQTLRYGPNGYMRGIIYASIFDPALAPAGQPGAFIFYALKGQGCTMGTVHRALGSINVCVVRLTTANYANEIYQP